jgi:hypothetical protein
MYKDSVLTGLEHILSLIEISLLMLDKEVSLFVPRNAQQQLFTEAEYGLLNLLVHAVTIKFEGLMSCTKQRRTHACTRKNARTFGVRSLKFQRITGLCFTRVRFNSIPAVCAIYIYMCVCVCVCVCVC